MKCRRWNRIEAEILGPEVNGVRSIVSSMCGMNDKYMCIRKKGHKGRHHFHSCCPYRCFTW